MKTYMSQYVTPKTMRDTYGVSNNALKKWENNRLIKTIRTPGGKRLYNIQSFDHEQNQTKNQTKKRVCYCRVSTVNQKEDLDCQIKSLQGLYHNTEIITDIESGINFKRKGLR